MEGDINGLAEARLAGGDVDRRSSPALRCRRPPGGSAPASGAEVSSRRAGKVMADYRFGCHRRRRGQRRGFSVRLQQRARPTVGPGGRTGAAGCRRQSGPPIRSLALCRGLCPWHNRIHPDYGPRAVGRARAASPRADGVSPSGWRHGHGANRTGTPT